MNLDQTQFACIVGVGSILAGFLGSLTGMGGGTVLVPMLVMGMGVDMKYAIGASLVSVIATSSASAAAYVKEGYSNVRVGMFLEIATTFGAISGALLAARTPTNVLAIVFGAVLLYSVWLSLRQHDTDAAKLPPNKLATWLNLDGDYPTPDGLASYHVQRVPAGFSIMYVAGLLSGLLGIGSGAVKVLALDQAMKLPFKVSTTTSNFMIGVTAAASAGVYFARGYIAPGLAMPVTLGVLVGAFFGTKVLVHAKPQSLRLVFAIVVALLGVEMINHGLAGRL